MAPPVPALGARGEPPTAKRKQPHLVVFGAERREALVEHPQPLVQLLFDGVLHTHPLRLHREERTPEGEIQAVFILPCTVNSPGLTLFYGATKLCNVFPVFRTNKKKKSKCANELAQTKNLRPR